MSNYFKLKRPFVSKTDKLPDGTHKELAKSFKKIEVASVEIANAAKGCKGALKKWSLLQSKLDKEKNDNKKAKLNEQLSKLKDEITDYYIQILESIKNMTVEEETQLKNIADSKSTFLTPDHAKKLCKKMEEVNEAFDREVAAAQNAVQAANRAEKSAEQLLEEDDDDSDDK